VERRRSHIPLARDGHFLSTVKHQWSFRCPDGFDNLFVLAGVPELVPFFGFSFAVNPKIRCPFPFFPHRTGTLAPAPFEQTQRSEASETTTGSSPLPFRNLLRICLARSSTFQHLFKRYVERPRLRRIFFRLRSLSSPVLFTFSFPAPFALPLSPG